jgi:hypothetical protein
LAWRDFALSGATAKNHDFGLKGALERLGECPNFLKIIRLIGVAFSQDSVLDQLKNNVPNLRAVLNSPFIEDCFGHRTEFLKGQMSKSVQKLLALDVGGGLFVLTPKPLNGMIQATPDKIVRGRGKSRIGFPDLLDRLLKGKLSHPEIMMERGLFVYGLRAMPPPTPSCNQDDSPSKKEKDLSFPFSQIPNLHGQIRFTIRPGTIMIFWMLFPPVQASKSEWPRIMDSTSSRVAWGWI